VFTVDKSGDLSGIAREIERAAVQGQKDAGRAVAKDGRKFILDDVRRARGSLRMMGGRLGVKQRVTATAASSVVELYAAPAGPWTIVTKGTRAYDIKPRRAEVLAAGHGDVIGTRAHRRRRPGHDYWSGAVARLDAELGPLVERAVDAQMGRV
jgi:hypothetical protein